MNFYSGYTDVEIKYFVNAVRGMSIRADYYRHRVLIYEIKGGVYNGYNLIDLTWIQEWAERLKGIMNSSTSSHQNLTTKTPA